MYVAQRVERAKTIDCSMKLRLLFILILFVGKFESGLISQSSIQSCDWGDSNEPTTKDGSVCKEKFVVSMTMKSGQGEVEALYANINQVHTSADSAPSALKKPFRIEVQKSHTITNYRVYYRGSVNALPTEHTRIFSRAKHCHDGWYEQHLSCGKQQSISGSEEFAWDSQGFCCKCSSYVREIKRSKGVCMGGIASWFKHKFSTGYSTYYPGKKTNFGSSAHCLRMDDLWYDVYDIELPMMLYNISVRLMQYEGKMMDTKGGGEVANWTTISNFFLAPSKTMCKSEDGKVFVELQGDLVGANGPQDFSVKKLLIPSLKVWKLDEKPVPPPAYTNGPGDWLLVDDHLVDLSGQQCNKVGVSYTGFKRQNSPCDKPEHSCFTNQPLQLWAHDDELRKAGKPGMYMVHNYGIVHPSTHATNHSFILRFIHTDLHNSFVTFRIDASDIAFVYNAARGRIVDAYATAFTAVKEVGQLYVEVENTGQLESEYSVVLSDCLGRTNTPSKVVIISPGVIANVSFSLQSYKAKGENSVCEVELFDKSFNLLGTTKVDVSVKGACFCFGECGCTCGSGKGSKGNSTALPCATPPPVIVNKTNLARDIFFLVLESIGIHGIVGVLGGILLFLGFIKLMCGGIVCCRKTKAQEHHDNLIKKGVDPKSPLLVRCTEHCRGAKAAKVRYKRKIERLKKIGKDPGMLDDWRNTSYVCGCRDELADIRFAYVLKALCFYYYCFCLPVIWLGKKIWWSVFKDTAAKKEAAEKSVLNQAKKKGKLEKYGVIDLAAELKNIENERNELRGETYDDQHESVGIEVADGDQKIEKSSGGGDEDVKQSPKKKLDRNKPCGKAKKDKRKQELEVDKVDSGLKTDKCSPDNAKPEYAKKTDETGGGGRTDGKSKKCEKKKELPTDDSGISSKRGTSDKLAKETVTRDKADGKSEKDVKRNQRKADKVDGDQNTVRCGNAGDHSSTKASENIARDETEKSKKNDNQTELKTGRNGDGKKIDKLGGPGNNMVKSVKNTSEKDERDKTDGKSKAVEKSHKKGEKTGEERVGLDKEKQLRKGDVKPKSQRYERKNEQPLSKESAGYREETSEVQCRAARKSTADSEIRSHKPQRPPPPKRPHVGDKQKDDKVPRVPRKAAPVKTGEGTRSKTTSKPYNDGKEQRPESSGSDKSLLKTQSKCSHESEGSGVSQLESDADVKSDNDKEEFDDDIKMNSHASLRSADEGDFSTKATVDEIGSDANGKNLEREGDASSESDSHDHHSDDQHSDHVSSVHSGEIGLTHGHSHQSLKKAESAHSDMANPITSHHSDDVLKKSSSMTSSSEHSQTSAGSLVSGSSSSSFVASGISDSNSSPGKTSSRDETAVEGNDRESHTSLTMPSEHSVNRSSHGKLQESSQHSHPEVEHGSSSESIASEGNEELSDKLVYVSYSTSDHSASGDPSRDPLIMNSTSEDDGSYSSSGQSSSSGDHHSSSDDESPTEDTLAQDP